MILVFSKTEGYRHNSIESGIKALKKLGAENDIKVTATEDVRYIEEDSLIQYAAVVFLNTSGDILNYEQRADLERYIQAGGGFVGVHAAANTEYDWPWYNQLVGAYFDNHPKVQEAIIKVIDKNHSSTSSLDSIWVKTDEWYNFRDFNPNINVALEVDGESFEGGKHGVHHPISWYHNFDGGRSFYTGLGHTNETYYSPIFLKHLLGGIQYAMGNNALNYQLSTTDRVPKEDRFEQTVLDFNLNEPMELDEIPGKGILFVERRGLLKFYDFKTERTKNLAQMDVFYGHEEGLLGLAVDPNYQENHWIYLFYSVVGEEKQNISRFTLNDFKLDIASEKVLLSIPIDRGGNHIGGALEFGPKGHLFITVGDNTIPFQSSGFAPIDEREGRLIYDAQKSAGNTNDLRGAILRIKPEKDGTYSIPGNNLFPVGTPKTRPEIYVKGCRNPFRASVDSKTGYVYWGDVGPDAGKADPSRGPAGMGEFNQARKPGFWGWPYTRGYNEPYFDFDFATGKSGKKFDPDHLINDSPNNTGMKRLPIAQKSMIPMTYYRSKEFPWMGEGGINPMAGPVFHASDLLNAQQPFPEYFESKLFLYDWMRNWIYVVTLDDSCSYIKADAFMPNTKFSRPMDMIFGSDGNLYLLEYGQKWKTQNLDARLSRISYNPGNRKPLAKITQNRAVGSIPLTVQFSAAGSRDPEGDPLFYQWSFTNDDVQSTEINPTFTFTEPGHYTIRLKVTDAQGETTATRSKILAGNDVPQLSIHIEPWDTVYRYDKIIKYTVIVNDRQDGSTKDGTIDASKVTVTFNFVPEGRDIVQATLGHQSNPALEGKQIIDETDCKGCHAVSEKISGPSYAEIAKKYTETDKDYLIAKIIKGGAGVWGENPMSAHPQLRLEDVSKIVDYILSILPTKATLESLPLEGTISFNEHIKNNTEGSYVLMASYLDNGITGQEGTQLMVSEQIVFNK
ncbi:MAG: hypothetical protein DHS20C17_00910 [Cyclobacteriaceae bacterium]|nr:MAG: hypothetical protein DHS20C17_00910 [Cyclobacteriaceae bacterium]